MKKIILASQSPRRKELLEKCGITFQCVPADIDESMNPNNDLKDEVQLLSYRKANAVLDKIPDAVVIGSDTIVVLNGHILGKPKTEQEAFQMLKSLAGNTHHVMTGLCLLSSQKDYRNVSISEVTFAPMSDQEIRDYIATGECMDKAGAYGVQGYAGKFITHINGDFYTIMGLPLNMVYEELKNLSDY